MNNQIVPNKILFLFIVLDVALFPVSPIFAFPYSLFVNLLIFFHILYRKRLESKPISYYILIVCLLISGWLSVLFKEKTALLKNDVNTLFIDVQREDIKRLLFILFGFIIYESVGYLYRRNRAKLILSIKWVLYLIIAVFSLLGIIFLNDYLSYYQIKNLFFNSNINLTTNEVLINTGYFERYNFILLDPNNACYFILMVIMFLLEIYSLRKITRVLLWLSAIFALVLTKSVGGGYALIIYIVVKNFRVWRKKVNIKYVISVVFILAFIGVIFWINLLIDNKIIDFFKNTETVQRWSDNSMDSRYERYGQILKSFPPLWGSGYTLIRDGFYINPHSDHLRFLYSYGLVAYISLLFISVKKRYLQMRYSFLIPVVIAFTINSLIDESRFFYLALILLAISKVETNQNTMRLK